MTQDTPQGFELSPLQRSHWRLREAFPETAWSSSIVVRLEGSLELARLEEACARLVVRHELLRTAFRTLPGSAVPVQHVLERGSFRLETVELDAAEDATAELQDVRRRLAGEFDVASGDTLHMALVRGEGGPWLVIAQPFLAGDWRSLWNLVRELARELAPGQEHDDPMQFADLAQWQRDMLSGEQAPQGIAHWKSGGYDAAPATLPLEFDRGSTGFAPAELDLGLEDADWTALDQAAERVASDRGTLVLSVWQLLLARHTAPALPPLALTAPGRTYEGLDEALGPFARALPLQVRVDPRDSLGALVRSTAATRFAAEDAYEFFDPDTLGFARDFTTPYVFDHAGDVEPVRAGDLTLRLTDHHQLGERFRLRLSLHAAGEGTPGRLRLGFDPRFYSRAAARTLADQMLTVLRSGCADASGPISGLVSLSTEARRALIEQTGQGAELELPAEPGLVQRLFLDRAQATPAAAAVASGKTTLTYAQLELRSRTLAARLAEAGVEPGDYVGIHLGRSIHTIVAIVGALRAGAAYLPLPPDYPAERLGFMLADTAAKVVVTADGQPPAGFTGTVLDLSTLVDDETATTSESFSSDLPAYVIFTSGSTGRPKGVPVSHANLVYSTRARLAYYEEPVQAYLLLSSFAFDSSVAGIFWTLSQGGTLVLPQDGFEEDLPALADLVQEHGVTHLLGLPSLWSVLLESASTAALESLRAVIVAGESCPPDLVARHVEGLPETRLFNEYGPTEATVWCSVHDCRLPLERAQVPIGRPIPGAELHVVTPRGEPAGIGFAGEIWIGGPGVTAGYLGRPELTAERFVEHPFGGEGRLYRTGDRGRFLASGELEFLGRLDSQVKIRGYRIELEGIEARLVEQDGVQEAVVLAQEERPGDFRLVAHVTPATLDEESLRQGLAATLPSYMQPSRFAFHGRFPKLPNGKVDRQALAIAAPVAAAKTRSFEEPQTALEKVVATIWRDLLGVTHIGRGDDFFALGGHSILATQLFARLIDTLQAKIPLRALFEHRTLSALAQAIVEQEGERIERTAEIVLQVIELSDDEADAALGA